MASTNLTIDLLRADDLLALSLEFVNLTLDTTAGQAPRLLRPDAGQPAFVIVHFPPQHIAEQVFLVDSSHRPEVNPPPVGSVLASASRLAFRVPDDLPFLPFTLEALLNWSQLEPQMVPNALPEAGTDDAPKGPAPGQPGPLQTAIELPYRVVLSPDASAGWAHAPAGFTSPEGRTELWHTRLGVRASGAVDETALPALRAVWSPDLLQNPFPDRVASSLTQEQRRQIVRLSSDFAIAIDLIRDGLGRPVQPLQFLFYQPPSLEYQGLRLSALGGSADLRGTWQFPTSGPPEIGAPPPLGLLGWRHLVSLGRDQYVRVVTKGFLYPFGHRAILITVTERALVGGVDYLSERFYIVVQEPEKDYESLNDAYASKPPHRRGEGREMPLRRVRITTLTTPEITNFPPGAPLRIDVPKVGSDPFRFHLVAEDWEGATIDFSLPLVFVPIEEVANVASARDIYKDLREADLRGQRVAHAKSPDKPGAATLATATMSFTAQDAGAPDPPSSNPNAPPPTPIEQVIQQLIHGLKTENLPPGHPPFLPVVDSATVRIPAVDHLLGSSGAAGAVSITMARAYLDNGLSPANSSEVFAGLTAPLDLRFPADKAGGLVTPNMAVDGLSRSLGPVPRVDDVVKGQFTPSDVFGGLDTKLLGAIDLKKLIQAVSPSTSGVDPTALAAQVPALVQTRAPGALTTSYTWAPQVVRINDPDDASSANSPIPLVTTGKTTLKIRVQATASIPPVGASNPPDPPSLTVDGTLSNFALNLFGIVLVTFDSMTFHAGNGGKMDLKVAGVQVQFMGALSLVNNLADLLPSGGFGDGPSLEVTPEGITAGYTLGIPNAGVGAFSLENIALSAKLSLPLPGVGTSAQAAALRLAFSERFHPFLVTMSLIGGGGFLAVKVNTGGIEQIEGSLELGGNITVSLIIVEANIHAMLGFYFGLTQVSDGVQIDFSAYIRIGGSVDLLGIISVSIELYVGLSFTSSHQPGILGVVGGRGSLTIGVHILFVDKSFSLTLERHFDIPDPGSVASIASGHALLADPSFDEMVSLEDWTAFCQAFA